MRVQATNNLGVTASPVRRSSAGGAFSVAEAETPRQTAHTTAPRTLASLDLLVALQGYEDPTERRRRAVRHGRTALDALDALKVGLIAGDLDQNALSKLKTMAESLAEPSGDPGLDAILAEIGLRAAVELAKFARR